MGQFLFIIMTHDIYSLLGALGYDRLSKINGASTVPFAYTDNDRLKQADYMGECNPLFKYNLLYTIHEGATQL